jgi:hypothetical protein
MGRAGRLSTVDAVEVCKDGLGSIRIMACCLAAPVNTWDCVRSHFCGSERNVLATVKYRF